MSLRVILDYEGRSEVDLLKAGGWRYASDPSTELLCCGVSWRENDGAWVPPHLVVFNWGDEGQDAVLAQEIMWNVPLLSVDNFVSICNGADNMVAHNAEFERALTACKFPQISIDDNKWTCTASRARRMGYPGKLETLCDVLEFGNEKDAEGHKVMLQLCKPRAAWKKTGKGAKYFGDAVRFAKNFAYCAQDIRAEIEADMRLPELGPRERARWLSLIAENTRGLQLDYVLIQRMEYILGLSEYKILEALRQGTGGLVTGVNSYPPMDKFVKRYGVRMPSWGADIIAAKLKDFGATMPAPAKLVLETRQTLAKSSTKKLTAMKTRIMGDNKARENAIYAGAHTLRNTGVGIQVLNMPRGEKSIDDDAGVAAILSGDLAAVEAIGKPHAVVSNCLRQTIIPSPGKKFCAVDYGSVEARGVFYLAGQEDGLALFQSGADIYIETANEIYRRNDLTKDGNPKERQLGKATVLGCGYQMWVATFLDTCETQYGMKIGVDVDEEMAKTAILAYRDKWHRVPQLWADLEANAVAAVQNPHQWYQANLIHFYYDGHALQMWLPSQRPIYYPFARIVKNKHAGKLKDTVEFTGKIPMSGGKYGPVKMYGGKFAENATQAFCRDIMEYHKEQIASEIGDICMTVYDEIVAEVDERDTTALARMEAIMKVSPPYVPGLPLAVEGWEGMRYHK